MSDSEDTTATDVARLPKTMQQRRLPAESRDEQQVPLHIAIVGCGPRGAQVLETISRRLSASELKGVHVTIFETAPHLGAGQVYDPTQPHVLRMNFATQHIDFWKFDRSINTKRSGSLIGWLKRSHPALAETDQYIPRAIVGEYLSRCFRSVRSRFTAGQFIVQSKQVVDILRESDCDADTSRWIVRCRDGSSASFDEVVLTTGHEGSLERAGMRCGHEPHTLFPFPIAKQLSEKSVPPGSSVLVRGFGLTAIDVILALTQERDWPARMTVISRSGRPMLAKPTAAVEPIDATFWEVARTQLRSLQLQHDQLQFHRDLWPILTKAATELLSVAGITTTETRVEEWYRGWSGCQMDHAAAMEAIHRSHEVATAALPKDIPYALGEVWRKLYPELVELVSHGGLQSNDWNAFASVAKEMERIAFGPPASSIRSLMSLIDHGVLYLSTVDDESRSDRSESYDRIIHAVIASPTQLTEIGPIASLLKQGLIDRDESSGGIKVDHAGRPLQPTDSTNVVRGLAIFGRATEGWILGNDTLTRTMHPQMERLAETLIATLHDRCHNRE